MKDTHTYSCRGNKVWGKHAIIKGRYRCGSTKKNHLMTKPTDGVFFSVHVDVFFLETSGVFCSLHIKNRGSDCMHQKEDAGSNQNAQHMVTNVK